MWCELSNLSMMQSTGMNGRVYVLFDMIRYEARKVAFHVDRSILCYEKVEYVFFKKLKVVRFLLRNKFPCYEISQ